MREREISGLNGGFPLIPARQAQAGGHDSRRSSSSWRAPKWLPTQAETNIMKLVLVALALAAAPSGLAMGPFVPYPPTWACKDEDMCGSFADCGICDSCTDPGWDCYRLHMIPCESGLYMSCAPPGNCKGVELAALSTGTIWAQSCCSSDPYDFAICPEES